MPEPNGRAARNSGNSRRSQLRSAIKPELLERSVGEPLLPGAEESGASTVLRPQQERNVVWRWQLRRRNRAG